MLMLSVIDLCRKLTAVLLSPLSKTLPLLLQFKRQNKEYEKTKTRIMEIANYVDKVRLMGYPAAVCYYTNTFI